MTVSVIYVSCRVGVSESVSSGCLQCPCTTAAHLRCPFCPTFVAPARPRRRSRLNPARRRSPTHSPQLSRRLGGSPTPSALADSETHAGSRRSQTRRLTPPLRRSPTRRLTPPKPHSQADRITAASCATVSFVRSLVRLALCRDPVTLRHTTRTLPRYEKASMPKGRSEGRSG